MKNMKNLEFVNYAIIFYVFNTKLTGSVINAFEYFFSILEHNPEVKLILLDASKSDVEYFLEVVNDRYDLRGLNYDKNIIRLPLRMLVRRKFGKALVLDYSTINKTRGLLVAKDLVVISEKKTDDPEYMYNKNFYNVTYYGEMPFHYKDKDYRMKMLFDRFKPISIPNEAIYVNSPHNKHQSFVSRLNLPDKPIIFKLRIHQRNLFEQFDTFVYYHANKWFDPHPRLFVESCFYDKEIMYFNKYDIKDGSYYRYNDIMLRGTENRTLSKDDEIVRQFI
ncbi:MAG: hypothetical protein ACTSX1_02605 [Candidatus Heimdallarchaeaceae archaeon]